MLVDDVMSFKLVSYKVAAGMSHLANQHLTIWMELEKVPIFWSDVEDDTMLMCAKHNEIFFCFEFSADVLRLTEEKGT